MIALLLTLIFMMGIMANYCDWDLLGSSFIRIALAGMVLATIVALGNWVMK